jgi:hypothetical protein
MNSALRPMRMGEILDRTFHIYRERFVSFAAISAAPAAMMAGLQLADHYWWHLAQRAPTYRTVQIIAWSAIQGLAYRHAAILIYALFTPAIVWLTSAAVFEEPASARASLRFSFHRWRSFLWIGVLSLAVVLLAAELATGGVLAALGSSMDALGLLNDDSPGYIALVVLTPLVSGIVLLLWLSGCCAFMIPACAFEDIRGFKAVRRSWKLSREGRWRVAISWLMLFLLSWVLLIGVLTLFRWMVILIEHAWPGTWHVMRVVYQPATIAIQAILAIAIRPLYAIAGTLFYYDQRIRKEGFDIERLMQSMGMVETAVEPAPAGESAEPGAASVPVEETGA